ncbi:MAG TPA: cyclodeaminase/cyclohydrolase family protein [Phycisphaerales bacterium]|nr:cyclodeaminase/cyclohydrolase family protein [Phycisphaerales bacterium]
MPFASTTIADFLKQTAAKTPTPGGGAVASAVGALSAALAQMVVSYSLGKKNLADHQPRLTEAALILERARAVLLELAEEDAAAYGLVNELQKLPEGDPRRAQLPAANAASVQVPLAVMAACVDLLRLFVTLAPITNRQLRSDLAIAAILAEATARGSRWNVEVNLAFLNDDAEKARSVKLVGTLLPEAARLAAEAEKACS